MTQLGSSNSMSLDACISLVSARLSAPVPTTYKVLGLEYGMECWAATAPLTSQTSLVGDQACNLMCGGGAVGERCGGRGMYNYYVATDVESVISTGKVAVRTSGVVRTTSAA